MIKTNRCEVAYLYSYDTKIPTGEVYIYFINDNLDDDYYFEFVVKCDRELAYKTMAECINIHGFPVCDKNNQYDSLIEQPTVKEFIKRMGCTPYPFVNNPRIEYQYVGNSFEKWDFKDTYWKLCNNIDTIYERREP